MQEQDQTINRVTALFLEFSRGLITKMLFQEDCQLKPLSQKAFDPKMAMSRGQIKKKIMVQRGS